MTRKCDFVLSIDPMPWRRARVQRVGRSVRHFTDAKTAGYKLAVEFAAKCAMGSEPLLEGPIVAEMVFLIATPASWSHRKAVAARSGEAPASCTPDVDNLSKAILDACNEVVFADDRQVFKLTATKRYSERGGIAVSFEEFRE